jgi:hypothetical protein
MMMANNEPIILAPTYYLDNFEYLLNFVQQQYADLLLKDEIAIIQNFMALSTPARCLYVRMYNRKGLIFKALQLKYTEIPSTKEAVTELEKQQFIAKLDIKHSHFFADLLAIFTKNELLEIVKVFDTNAFKQIKNQKVAEIYQYITENINYQDFLQIIDNELIVLQEYEKEMLFFRFLFFGNLHQDMTEFVMRDIGVTRFETQNETQFTPLFKTRQEAEEKWKLIEAHHFLSEQIELLRNYPEKSTENNLFLENLATFFIDWVTKNFAQHETSANTYQRLLLRLGELFEKKQLTETALQFYELATMPPAAERQARIYYAKGEIEKALTICEKMQKQPQNAQEFVFAQDFTQKITKKLQNSQTKFVKTVTKYLQTAESITIDIDYKNQVEMGAAMYYKELGYEAIFVENFIWRAVFALVCWEVIFNSPTHNPLQRRPVDFYATDFFEKRKDLLINLLATLDSQEKLQNHLIKTYQEKQQTANPFIQWHEDVLNLALLIAKLLPLESLKNVLLEMAKNMKNSMVGFPDILIWNENDYCFIEVKSPTDNLSAQQLFWLQFFENQGIKAKVLRVNFQ